MRCHLIFLFVFLTIAACLAEPPRRLPQQRRRPVQQRFQRLRQPSFGVRTHLLARQQAAPAATPYPAAEDLKPAVSFEPQPELTYGPPAQLYGPPAEQLPETALPQEFVRNPEAEEIETTAKPARLVNRLQRLQQQTQPRPQTLAKLVQPQQPQLLQQEILQPAQAVRPLQPAVLPVGIATTTAAAALTAAPVVSQIAAAPFAAPVATFSVPQQQFYVINQPFAYTAQYQSW